MQYLGELERVLKTYRYGRPNRNQEWGWMHDGFDPSMDPQKHYAIVFTDDEAKYAVRNFFQESVQEKNMFFEDATCRMFYLGNLKKVRMEKDPDILQLVEFTLDPEKANLSTFLQTCQTERTRLDLQITLLSRLLEKPYPHPSHSKKKSKHFYFF